jgi:hypothetical protein
MDVVARFEQPDPIAAEICRAEASTNKKSILLFAIEAIVHIAQPFQRANFKIHAHQKTWEDVQAYTITLGKGRTCTDRVGTCHVHRSIVRLPLPVSTPLTMFISNRFAAVFELSKNNWGLRLRTIMRWRCHYVSQ